MSDIEYMEYKGSKFGVREGTNWYRRTPEYEIVRIETASEQLWLPEEYKGRPVSGWYMETDRWERSNNRQKYFPEVKILYLPQTLKRIEVDNDMFPNLEIIRIDPANQEFSTDGKMIFRKDGRELANCLVCKGECIEIPESVRQICAGAFRGTEYREIVFGKNDIRLDKDAFLESNWLRQQNGMVVIGAILYKVPSRIDCLTVPAQVRRFHPELFQYDNVPKKLETPIMPTRHDVDRLEQVGGCRSLGITSAGANINITVLRRWKSLEEVMISEQHKKYAARDGVVYSKDGKILVWYPVCRKDREFVVPEGIRKIGEFAFAGQKYIRKVTLPDSVGVIGTCAFLGCKGLEEVYLPDRIREIPDSSAYQRGGVFEGCESLRSVVLPEKLEYLGSYAFYGSGLTSVAVNRGLEQIGEYALMAKGLREISLPPSVKRIGKGALYYIERAGVYEGTAKGIVAAVNSVQPDMKEKSANVEWKRCELTVLHRRNDKRGYFLIPGSLKRSAAYHLDMAWNADCIDYEEYGLCLSEITDTDEKLEFAEQGLLRYKDGDENIYSDYMRQVAYKMGCRLLKEGKEKEFMLFVKKDFLTENALSRLLRYSNEQGMTVCSAYIMNVLNKKGRKVRSLRI